MNLHPNNYFKKLAIQKLAPTNYNDFTVIGTDCRGCYGSTIHCMTYVFQEEIVKMTYTWALCRDQEELDPKAAWKLLEFSAMKTNVII